MEHGVHELTAAYALDALDDEERRAYEEHLPGCGACRDELASFWEVTAALALETTGPEPRPELRDRILASVQAEPQNVVALRKRHALPATRVATGIAAVAAVAAIALGGWAISLHGRLGDANDLLALERSNLSVVSDPSARQVALATGRGQLVVGSGGRAVMIVDGLTRAPAGKTYEVWVIHGTTPTRAGEFAGGGGRSIVSVDGTVAEDAVVAVTLERSGGVDAPTTAPLVASEPV